MLAAIPPAGLCSSRAWQHRADSAVRGLVDALDLQVRLLNATFEAPMGELVTVAPVLGVSLLVKAARSIARGVWQQRYVAGVYGPSAFLDWLDTQAAVLEASPGVVSSIRALPAFPTAEGLVALEDAVLPGDFVDLPDLAELLVLDNAGRHKSILGTLGVKELTFRQFATVHVPRALKGNVSDETRRAVIDTIGGRAHEFCRYEFAAPGEPIPTVVNKPVVSGEPWTNPGAELPRNEARPSTATDDPSGGLANEGSWRVVASDVEAVAVGGDVNVTVAGAWLSLRVEDAIVAEWPIWDAITVTGSTSDIRLELPVHKTVRLELWDGATATPYDRA
jgi:hypothetical protein